MARYSGLIGYVTPTQTSPGIWEDIVVTRHCFGDILQNTRRIQSSDNINSDISISNEISIVADPFAINNFQWIRYAELMGTKWAVNSVRVEYPRLILSLGGLYNG